MNFRMYLGNVHVNDWKEYASFNSIDEIRDELAFPSFCASRGTLVQIRAKNNGEKFVYLFGNTKFIDLSARSHAQIYFTSMLEDDDSVHARYYYMVNPPLLVSCLKHVFDKYEVCRGVIRALESMTRYYRDIPEFAECFEQCKEYALHQQNLTQLRHAIWECDAYARIPALTTVEYFQADAIRKLISDPEDAVRSMRRFIEDYTLLTAIREEFPFHTVADKLITKYDP